jgi:hypothetical protein
MAKAPVRRSARRSPVVPAGPLPELSPDDIAEETVDQLTARGAAYAREYAIIEDRPTILLRNLAAVLVTLRMKCTDQEGRPDLTGRSAEYRELVGSIYRTSLADDDQRQRTQQAVRWHVNNLLHERFSTAELTDYGLKETSALTRMQASRQERAALVAAARGEDLADAGSAEPATPKATATQLTVGKAIRSMLSKINVDVVDDEMTDGQRAVLDNELAEAQKIIASLRRHTRKRSSAH